MLRLDGNAALVHAALAAGALVSAGRAAGAFWPVGNDAHAYWAARLERPYAHALAGNVDAFLYSPALLHAVQPMTLLPFEPFLGAWTLVSVVALVYVAGPLTLLVVLAPPVWLELVVGNVNLLMAAAIVIGFRFPAAWAFVLLSKVTPGVGLVWFVVRREWRELLTALGATAAIASVSVALDPGLWAEWASAMVANAGRQPDGTFVSIPLVFRLPIAIAIVAVGARNGWRWSVPVGALLAMPVLWESAFAILVAVIPLLPWTRAAERWQSPWLRRLIVLERT